jgi:hypothetical protein
MKRIQARLVGRILIAGCCCFATIPSASGAFTMATATLAGPATIPKEGTATYTFSLMGSMAGGIVGTALRWSAYEQDSGVDDELVAEKAFVVTDNAAGMWSYTNTLDLTCTADCILKGPDGSDDAMAPGTIFVLIESVGGGDVGMTNTLNVNCTPEPAAKVLAAAVSMAVMGCTRRRRSRLGRSGHG